MKPRKGEGLQQDFTEDEGSSCWLPSRPLLGEWPREQLTLQRN